MITSQELKELMDYCTGTESYHAIDLGKYKILLTDGALLFAQKAEAFWFIDELRLNLLPKAIKKSDEWLFNIHLIVKGDKANIEVRDGDGEVVSSKHISYTDCPEGTWTFYYNVEDKVLMYFMEY